MELTFNKKYKVVDTIGKGGFSIIYKVLEIETNEFYALKYITIVNNKEIEKFREEFEKEIEVMKIIKNKYIIELKDYFIVNNKNYYIVMELCDCNLKDILNKNKPNGLPIIIIKKIFTQLNEALNIMRKNNYYHRDLKPENILIKYTDKNKINFDIKLTDFGLSSNEINSIYQSHSNVGTDIYKAPEVDRYKYNNKSDLWSLGIILYELYTNKYIFYSHDKIEEINNKYKGRIVKETDNDMINELIRKLIQVDIENRIGWEEYFNDNFFKIKEEKEKNKKAELEKLFEPFLGRFRPFEPVLGIDLGTANSACAIYMNGVPIIIPNEIGEKTTPSVVSFRSSDKKDWVVGKSAYEGLGLEYEYNVSYIKRIIGLNKDDETLKKNLDNKEIFPFGYKFDEKDRVKIIIKTPKKLEDYGKKIENLNKDKVEELEFYPEEISAMVLKKLKDNAEKYINKKIKKAVITVPAHFHENQREATKNAGELAGLDIVNMINEPTSAALAYGIKVENNTSENYLVFDLGAGTFDVTILEIENENIEILFYVIGTSGENALGGRDFDKKMIEYINDLIKKSLNEKKHNSLNSDLSKEEKEKLKKAEEILSENIKLDEFDYYNDFNLNNRIKLACEMAKIRLSYNDEATIPLDTISLVCDSEIKITKKQFEDWNEELFEKCMTAIKNLLAEIKMDKSKIKNVILIGGASRMPKMQEKIKEYFGLRELLFKIDPEEAVCLGAAIKGAIINQQIDYKIKDIYLLDIIPFNYGIEVHGGKMDVILKKYLPIPIKKKKNI